MPITYEEAADIVYRARAGDWDPQRGTFILDDRTIIEDDEVYVFISGAREMIVDRNPAFLTVGGGNGVVSKKDGNLTWIPWVILMDARPSLKQHKNPNPRYFF
jgi:hypothetical protein